METPTVIPLTTARCAKVFMDYVFTPPITIFFILTDHRINEETPNIIGLNIVRRAKVFADYVAMQKQGLAEVCIYFYVQVILCTIFFVSTSQVIFF